MADKVESTNALALPDIRDMFAREETLGSFITSIDVNTPEGQVQLYNFTGEADEKIGDHLGEHIKIRHYFTHMVRIQRTDEKGNKLFEEDGETPITDDAPRVVLMTPEGITYGSVSWGVYHSVERLARTYGMGALPDITIMPFQKATKNGKNKTNALKLIG